MAPNPPQTPLRRLSQGSLFRLSRSTAYPDAPHGLGFLEPALAELIDEAEALQTNVEGLKGLSDALGTFNESFASWLYVMNMNALTTDWPQAPTEGSFMLAARRAEEDARAALEAIRAPKLSAKEKRERGLEMERLLSALPLEFRGNDPNLRRHMEMVVEKFWDHPDEAFNIVAFVKPPDLNQARVNKCLIALVNRKIVRKDNSTGSVLYHWNGLPR
ncbi:hypothetical protein OH77DRAFT_191124 [Trametes cingulata]|nr:hypothetical protein OH77DRAFT_191124 [Trametes cingulata]